MLSELNKYLLAILLTLFGCILLIFNMLGIIISQIQILLIILLTIGPSVYLLLEKNEVPLIWLIISIIVPLSIINYSNVIINSQPVGYQDVQNHIFMYMNVFDQSHHIEFQNVQTISFNFVGLYIIYSFICQILGISITTSASFIPQIFNISLILCVFIIANHFFSRRIAALSMLLFGWQIEVITFGQEFRTQTIGVVLIAIYLILLIINSRTKSKITVVLQILVTFSIITISFVTSLFFIIILLGLAFLPLVSKILRLDEHNMPFDFNPGIVLMFFTFIFSYVIYISGGFEHLQTALESLIDEVIRSDSTIGSSGNGIVNNPLRTIMSIFTKIVFALSILLFIFKGYNQRNMRYISLFAIFSGLGILYAVDVLFRFGLNPDRIFAVLLIVVSIIASYVILNPDVKKMKKGAHRFLNISIISIIIFFMAFSTIVQLPGDLIGKVPMVGGDNDSYEATYWRTDVPQYAVTHFIQSTLDNTHIIPYTELETYQLLDLCLGNEVDEHNGSNRVIVLHDLSYGKTFAHRDELPSARVFINNSNIYSSRDYKLYL